KARPASRRWSRSCSPTSSGWAPRGEPRPASLGEQRVQIEIGIDVDERLSPRALDVSRPVALTGRVVSQEDVARPQDAAGAVAARELALAREVQHELAPRCGVVVGGPPGWHVAEGHALHGRKQLEASCSQWRVRGELELDVPEVRLPVVTGVE